MSADAKDAERWYRALAEMQNHFSFSVSDETTVVDLLNLLARWIADAKLKVET